MNAAVAASSPLPDPPACVRVELQHRPFWDAILRSRASTEWSESDLMLAAKLARVQFDIEEAQRELDREGITVSGASGQPIVNPTLRAVEILTRREVMMLRALKLAGHAAGDPRDVAGKRKAERAARKVLEDLEESDPDGLLAR